MAFAPVLNSYCSQIKCSNKELAERCGISMSALSRYRSGKRVPRAGSDVLDRLAAGIVSFAAENGVKEIRSEKEVKLALSESLTKVEPLGPSFTNRVDSLMRLLGVRNADVAIPLHLDPSYISRIRRGERSPNDKKRFSEVLAQVSALLCMEQGLLDELLALMGFDGGAIESGELNVDSAMGLAESIDHWLLGNQMIESDIADTERLLSLIDGGYYKAILEQPRSQEDSLTDTAPVISGFRSYWGGDLAWTAETDFLENARRCGAKHVWLSTDMPAWEEKPSPERVTLYQRMILELIDQGCDITVIHDSDIPLRQGLSVMWMWLPLWMTGHVKPLFMVTAANRTFRHVNNVCEYCALVSESVRGHEDEGRYNITSLPDDIKYYRKKMDFILEHTTALIEIYSDDDPEGMKEFERAETERRNGGVSFEVKAGCFQHLRIFSHKGECATVYLDDGKRYRFVIWHPKLRYVISQMR